jgi:hypothetical protein
MVVDNLYVIGSVRQPNETDSPLIVNADAVLPPTVTFKRLEPIAGRHAQIRESLGVIDHIQLPGRHGRDRTQMLCNPPTLKEGLSVLASETFYHYLIRSTYRILEQYRFQAKRHWFRYEG